MKEDIFRNCSTITIYDDSKNATPEWIKKWGRFCIEVDHGRTLKLRGDDLNKLIAEMEQLLEE
jgi:hypothetical protein